MTDIRHINNEQIIAWRQLLAQHYGVPVRNVLVKNDGFYVYDSMNIGSTVHWVSLDKVQAMAMDLKR